MGNTRPRSDPPVVLVEGNPSPEIAVSDRGFQYGEGTFTTLRVVDRHPLFLAHHLVRLERDARQLGIPTPDRSLLVDEIDRLLQTRSEDGIIKIQLTQGSGGRGYRPPVEAHPRRVVSWHPLPKNPPSGFENGVAIRLCQTRLGINPKLAGIKHMNRLEQVLARSEWEEGSEFGEGLMLDSEGFLVEGTMTNLFLVRRGRLLTPRLDRCGVSGIMRGLIMEHSAGWHEKSRLTLSDLFQAEEIFLTNSVVGIWPVRRVEMRQYPIGPITRKLNQWLQKTIQADQKVVRSAD